VGLKCAVGLNEQTERRWKTNVDVEVKERQRHDEQKHTKRFVMEAADHVLTMQPDVASER